MPTLITQASDLALWTELEQVRLTMSDLAGQPISWINWYGKDYLPVMLVDGTWAFNYYTELELMNDGSIKDTAGGSYAKLDDG